MADYFEDDQAAPGRSKPLTLEDQNEKDFFSDSDQVKK